MKSVTIFFNWTSASSVIFPSFAIDASKLWWFVLERRNVFNGTDITFQMTNCSFSSKIYISGTAGNIIWIEIYNVL